MDPKKPQFVSNEPSSDDGDGKPSPTRVVDPSIDPDQVTAPQSVPPTRIVGSGPSATPPPPPLPSATPEPANQASATRVLSSDSHPPSADDGASETQETKAIFFEPAPTQPLAPDESADEEPEHRPAEPQPVVGWLVITQGAGRGTGLPFSSGMNAIGRGSGNDVVVDFGDDSITSDAHAFIVYDEEKRGFHVTHAGQNDLVRLNDEPLLAPTPVETGADIRLGETTLRLVTFCGPDFGWTDD